MILIDMREIEEAISGSLQHRILHQGFLVFVSASTDRLDLLYVGHVNECDARNELYPLDKIKDWAKRRNQDIQAKKAAGKIRTDLSVVKLSGFRRLPQRGELKKAAGA